MVCEYDIVCKFPIIFRTDPSVMVSRFCQKILPGSMEVKILQLASDAPKNGCLYIASVWFEKKVYGCLLFSQWVCNHMIAAPSPSLILKASIQHHIILSTEESILDYCRFNHIWDQRTSQVAIVDAHLLRHKRSCRRIFEIKYNFCMNSDFGLICRRYNIWMCVDSQKIKDICS